MKTIELKWIEDDNHVVAEDAYTGLKELIETGVFPNLKVKCEDDVLYITGEKEDLDKAVMKIQKAYAKYGQIMIKEAKNGTSNELRIESFDDNVQDIFNHTLNDYETFKENCKNNKPTNYITTLGKFQYKFNKLKEAASRKDKKIIQNFLTEIDELTESFEEPRLKPIKEINESTEHDLYNKEIKKQLSNPANWGIIEDKLNEDSLDDFDDREIKSRIAAQSAEVKKFVDEQQNLIYDYVKNKWISLCEKYKIDRDTYYEVTCDTSFGNGQEPGSTLFMQIKIDYLKQFLNAIKASDVEEAEKWLYTKFCSDDCPFKVSPAWKPEVYNSGNYKYRIRIGFIIPEYTPKKPRKPRKPRDPNKGYKKPDYVNPDMKGGTYFDGDTQVYEMPEENESFNEYYKNSLRQITEKTYLSKDTFNKKFNKLVQTYADAEDLDLDVAYDLIADNDEIYEYVDSDMTIEDIMDMISSGEIILENKKIDESFVLSPSELKKKLQRVASKWASEKGVKFMEAYDELRKKKSVKDMLDFYSVDEIIEDLKKQRKEEDDELEVAI